MTVYLTRKGQRGLVSDGRILCAIDGCGRPAASGEWSYDKDLFCDGHRKRRLRGDTVSGELQPRAKTPFQALQAAAINLGNADPTNDGDWQTLNRRFKKALERYVLAYNERRRRG